MNTTPGSDPNFKNTLSTPSPRPHLLRRQRPVQLNPRDYEIFRLIQTQGAKTAAELARQFWNDKSKKAKAGFQRIRKLIKARLLERGNPRLLYLSERAKQMLSPKQNEKRVEGVQCSG